MAIRSPIVQGVALSRVTRTGIVCIFISFWEMKIKVSPGPYPASNSPPDWLGFCQGWSPRLHRTKGPLVQRGLSREQRDWGIVAGVGPVQKYRSALQSLSQKSKIFASSLYTREPFSVVQHSTTPPAFAGGA